MSIPDTGLTELDDSAGPTLSAERIGRLVERERAFSAYASHELRTPLTAVMVALETELLALRPDRRAVLTESLEALARLERTVTDLLKLARDAPGQRAALDMTGLLDRLRPTGSPPTGRRVGPWRCAASAGRLSTPPMLPCATSWTSW